MNKATVAQQTKTASFLPPTQGLLQRKCACGNHMPAVGGECAECAKKKSNFQRKLTIGARNDPLEREADRVSEQVMATPLNSAVNATPPRIQRFSGQASEGENTAPASVDCVLASSGRSLEPTLRQDMEQRFGYDFSQVRVHTGSAAEQSARDVNAHAYTVGNNVVFGVGRFSPGSHEGKQLLAHELTHVLQQSGSDENCLGQSHENRGLSSIQSLQRVDGGAPAAAQHIIACPDLVAVSAAMARARVVIASALAQMKAGPINVPEDERIRGPMHYFYMLFFHVQPGDRSIRQIFEVQSNFEILSQSLAQVTTRCVSSRHPDCASGQMLHNAFADVGVARNPVINLCPSFFNGSVDDQARTIIHELAHARLGIEHAGGRLLSFECGETRLAGFDEAIANAYVYDLFAHCLHASASLRARRGIH